MDAANPESIARLMAGYALSPDAQLQQTEFRMRLVDHWRIGAGWSVLEVGSGQGDTTAVLADRVGSDGRVVAVDPAPPEYGAPVTVIDSMRHLQAGPLGGRIDARYGFDLLDPANDFPPDAFDAAVFAHCTWYFDSLEQIRDALLRVRSWSPRLCLSEWDLQPESIDQLGHLLAVLIRGQIGAHNPQSRANIRTPYSRETLLGLLAETGWKLLSAASINTTGLADARWEVADCLREGLCEIEETDVTPKHRAWLKSQLDLLGPLAGAPTNRPLPAYSVVAERVPLDTRPADAP